MAEVERRHPSARRLAELVAAEADPFTFTLGEYRRLVDQLAPGVPANLRERAFHMLPPELRRIANAALRTELEAER